MVNPEKNKPNNIIEGTPETDLTFEQQILSLMGDFGIPEDCFIDFTEACFRETSRSIDLYFQKDYASLRDFSSPGYQDAIRKMNKPILRIRTAMETTRRRRLLSRPLCWCTVHKIWCWLMAQLSNRFSILTLRTLIRRNVPTAMLVPKPLNRKSAMVPIGEGFMA